MFFILFIFRNVLISRIVRSSLHEGPDTCQHLEYTDNRQIYSADYSYNKNNKNKKNNKNNLDDCGISSKKNTKKYDKVRMCSTCLVDLSECKDSSHCEVKESSFNLFLYDRFLSYYLFHWWICCFDYLSICYNFKWYDIYCESIHINIIWSI